MKEKSDQGKRLLLIYRKLLQGRAMTSRYIIEMLKKELGSDCSIRTVQRDVRLIQEFDTLVEREKRGKEYFWKYSTVNTNRYAMIEKFWNSEPLAFYLLKAQLKKFSGTKIEKETNKIIAKLEKFAPGDILIDNTFYWEKEYGYLDFRIYDDIIEEVINTVVGEFWVMITYESLIKNTIKEYEVRIMSLFFFEGTLYAVAYYPKYESFEPIAVHRILSIRRTYRREVIEPEFDQKEFIRKRFGVFGGEIKNVKLLIDKHFVQYFEGRRWHDSQKISKDGAGNLILEMNIPLGEDFIAWLMKWSEAITVLEPPELKRRLVNIYKNALDRYLNESMNV